MVLTLVLSAVATVVLYNVFASCTKLKRNIALAKSSGLPVVVTPVHVHSMLWLATFYIWIPLLRKFLPAAWKGVWLE
jgi:hypothetical protein